MMAVSREELRSLLKQQNYTCAISGVKLTPGTASLDHIVPHSHGGSDDIENAQWLHTEVNRMKGNLTNEEFRLWVGRVAEGLFRV